MKMEPIGSWKLVVTGYDGKDHWEKLMTSDEVAAINKQNYDHVLNVAADYLGFRDAAGQWIEVPLHATKMGPVCQAVLQAVQLNAGTFVEPADFAELTGNDAFYEPNNISRHFVVLRCAHRETYRAPRFFVTRRSGGFAMLWPAERTWIRIERIKRDLVNAATCPANRRPAA